jgi:hypothetical protein
MPVKPASSPVEPLGVALLGERKRRVDIDLGELAGLEQAPRELALAAKRRDQRDQHDQPRVDHQLRHLGDPADVLDTVGLGEPEVAVEAAADVVAVEQVGPAAELVQLQLEQVGDRRLAGAREAGEPDRAGLLAERARARRLVDVELLVVDGGGAAQRVAQHPRADRRVRDAVDHDEAAGVAAARVGVEGDRLVE